MVTVSSPSPGTSATQTRRSPDCAQVTAVHPNHCLPVP